MSTTGNSAQQCRAIVQRTGQRCASRALPGSEYCVGHDPHAVEWRRAGGKARSNANRAGNLLPRRLLPLVAALEQAFQEVRDGTRTERSGAALATIALAIGKLFEMSAIEERTRALEHMVAEIQAARERDALGGGPWRVS